MRLKTVYRSLTIAILSASLLLVSVKAVQSRTFSSIFRWQQTFLAQRSGTTPAQIEPAKANEDEQAIRQALQEWRQLYSYGNRKFTFNGYENLYINTDELLAYDNVAPGNTQINGWQTYRPLWERVINESFSGQRITRFDIDRVGVADDLGWSAITLRFRAKNRGKDFYSSQHGTHIWRKVDGQWRIVHEHMTAPVKVNGQEVTP